MSDLVGTRNLTYPGDFRASVGQVVGPDMFDGFWMIQSAEYVEGRTRVGLNPNSDEWSRIKKIA